MLLPISTKAGALVAALTSVVLCGPALAQSVVFSDVHTVAAPTQAVPVEHSFTVASAGNYQITLVDLGAQLTPPAPLTTVKLAVTTGSTIVGTPLLMAGSTTVSANPGDYVIHVVGTPGSVPGSGPIGIQVNNTADNSVLASFSDILAVPQQALPSSEGVTTGVLSVPSSGTYSVTLTDLQLPQKLSVLTLLLIQQGGASPLLILSNSGSLSGSVALTTGLTYNVFAVGQTSSTTTGGLFSAVVAPSGGSAPVYARTVAVGGTVHVGSPSLAAGNYTLKLTDLSTPAALSQLQGALVLNGTPVATLAAAGTQNFGPAAAGTYDAFAFAAPSSAPAPAVDAGSFALDVLPQAGGTPAFDAALAVATPGGNLFAYDFDASLSSAAAYSLNVADFQLPAALASLQVVAVQNGVVLGSASPSGGRNTASTTINAAAGPLTLLAFSQAGGASGGLFGVDVTASGAAAPAFEVSQGVGTVFAAHPFTITTAGNYSAAGTDLAFPASFANFDVIVTQGTSLVGSIFGGGTFFFQGTPGNYFVNLITQPTGSDQAGTYAVTVATAPPAPTISLNADHSSVTSGSSVDLSWSTQNATSCTATPAAGGFSGTQPLTGVFTSAALTTDTTFTLQCTGAGGTVSQSVKVMVTQGSSGGGGGGGSLDATILLLLAARALARLRRGAAVMDASRRMAKVPAPHG
jgi:hypothetical protein